MTELEKAGDKADRVDKLKEQFDAQFALYMLYGTGLSHLHKLQLRLQEAERNR